MHPTSLLELLIGLLAASLIMSAGARALRIPPAAALTCGGMCLALLPGIPSLELDPQLIMVLFLPPLLLHSAYFTVWRDFRANLRPILLLSVGAVAFTTWSVAFAARELIPGLSWPGCVALGAIVSPPDAVAAKAVLERLRLPRRLSAILEGESLVNDASGLVIYRFAVAATLTGSFRIGNAALSFSWLAAGGIALGLLMGWLTDVLARKLRDAHFLVVVSFLVAYVTYIVAEYLQVSGVLAVVACGMLVGWRQHTVLDARARSVGRAVWDVVVFVMETLIFVFIGLSLRGVLTRMGGDAAALERGLPIALGVIAAVVVSRLVWVYAGTYLPRLLSPSLARRDPSPPASIPLIITWAGMRGVVSLATALALPDDFPQRDLLLFLTFAVILATVLFQGTTLGPLIRMLGVSRDRPTNGELSELEARVEIVRASLEYLESHRDSDSEEPRHPKLIAEYRRRLRAIERVRDEGVGIEAERLEHFEAALGAVAVGRERLLRLHRAGELHDSLLHRIESDLDLEELRLRQLGGR